VKIREIVFRFQPGESAKIFISHLVPRNYFQSCARKKSSKNVLYIVLGKSAKLNSFSYQGKSAKYHSSRTCFEKTAMSSLNDSEEQTSPPAMPGSRGVQVASSHFSKISASRGKSGCLKNRNICELGSLNVEIGCLKIDFRYDRVSEDRL
jgi:hypothetical protein